MPPRVRPPTPLTHHLHEWRKAKKMTLQQVADAIGSSKSHLSQLENGNRELMPAVAEALAQLFGIDAETLRTRRPGEDVDLETELLALFRSGDVVQRRAIVDMARMVRSLDRRSVQEPDREKDVSDGT